QCRPSAQPRAPSGTCARPRTRRDRPQRRCAGPAPEAPHRTRSCQAPLHQDGLGYRLRVRGLRRVKRSSLVPATLFGRSVLLIAGLIVVAQIGVGLALIVTVQLPRAASVVRYAVQYTETLRQALEAMDRTQADRYIADLNSAGLTQIIRGNPP